MQLNKKFTEKDFNIEVDDITEILQEVMNKLHKNYNPISLLNVLIACTVDCMLEVNKKGSVYLTPEFLSNVITETYNKNVNND